jgi:gliding motility-associated-like protein
VFTITNPAAVCSPSTVNITNATSGTPGLVYTYWNDSATTNSLANPTVIAVSGTYYIKATNSFGCYVVSPVVVTINSSPSLTSNTTPSAICSGSTFNYTPTSASVGTITWTRNLISGISNPAVGPSSGTINEVLNNTTTSPITVVYNLNIPATANGCTNATPIALNVVVNPLPVFTITNPAAVCSPSSVDITNVASGTTGLVYSYWNNNAGTIALANPSVIATSGTYYIKATNSFGCYTITPVVVIINPLPVFTVTNPAAVCSPSTVDITNTALGTPGLVYTYWNNNAGTIALTNPSAIAASGTYYIKAINSFGCFTIKPVVLVINPKPVATVTGTNNFVLCQNGTQPVVTFTGSNGTTPYTFSYQINSGPILTVTSLATSNSVAVAIPTTTSGNYTVTLLSIQDSSSSLCISNNITLPNSAFVLVQPIGTIIPVNQNIISQTVCQGTAIAPIVFNIGGAATNAFVTGLPAGLNGVYNIATSTLTISGSPLISGVFNYVVNTSGSSSGCNSTFGGTITVNSNDTITALTVSTINQSVCSNVAIQPIIYNLGGGATGGIVTFSPSTPIGISWVINSNIITISGASNTIGTFNYTVQSFGICGPSTVTGTITIKNNATVTLVSGNPSPTVCQGSSFVTPIQFSISPNTATMILSGSLPNGVTFNPVTGILSGTPSQSGLFPYTISSNTGCGNSISGVINVNPLQSISFVSGNTNQSACQYSSIDPINFVVSSGVNSVTVTPALPAGITYNLVGNTLTISGTPTVSTSLPSNYIITTQGACGPQATYSVTFDIRPEATIVFGSGSGSINQAVCQSSAIVPITFTIGGGATGIIIPPLPAGLTLTQVGGVYTIQGNPLISGVYNFPITTTGCPKTVFVTISNVNTAVGITLTSAVDTDNQILCQTNFNSPITPIIYTVIGASNVVVSSLPTGVSAVFSPSTGLLIISGTPTQSGVFNYTITSSPCSIVKTGVIKISTPIFLTNEVVTNVSCSSLNDGAISVTIVGGVSFNGQYAIRWTGPNGFQQNQTTITGLQAGQYVLTGTDAIGCSIPTRTYTILPAVPINISLVSSTNVNCNGTLGCANFNITGGSGIYTLFTLQYLDPSSQVLVPILPANNNYYNICNLRAGRYYLTVRDSRNCTTIPPYLFNIYDYSSLSIETIIMDTNLCQDTPGNVRIKVNSLDTNLSFFYNSVLVPATYLGNSIYELSINNPTVPSGVIKVLNSQNCWVTTTVTTAIVTPNFTFTSSDFRAFGYYSVNGSVQFTNLVDMNNIPAEYDYVVWDFGDNTPFKVFRNPADLIPNAAGENFETVFHTYTTNGIYEITLTVYNHFGCSRKITKTIVIGSGATMMLPTIFTPNGDGINDLFRPSILGLKDVSMFIYDGWGNVVYEVSSEVALLNSSWGWNGVEKGQSEPKNNDYRYYIIATTINDKKIEKEGRFLLVK